MYDLVIVGSGPAGLSAAVYAKRAKMNVLVLEKESFSGGQIVYTEQVDNYLGMYGKSGYELSEAYRSHAEALQVEFREANVEKIEEKEEHKVIILENGERIETKTLLIATGATHKKLLVPGEEEFFGAGGSYCATCDGAFFSGKQVAVIGGGDVALEDALYLSKICQTVYLVHRRESFRGAKLLQEKVKETKNIIFLPCYEVEQIKGNQKVDTLLLKEKKTGERKELVVSGVFVAIGMEPESRLLDGLVELDESGYVVAGEDGITSNLGIFVAGDIRTKQLRQIVTAVSDGANAVYSIEKYLRNDAHNHH